MSGNTKKWVRIARCEDIPPREGRSIRVGDGEIAIFNLGDRFLAVSNRCPHKGGPLSEGIVSGNTVVCPLHAWRVSLETGEVARPADTLACVETFRVRVDGGVILVELPTAPTSTKESPVVCLERAGLPSVPKKSLVGTDDSDISNIRA
jgi:nitrite reductase (NADH) small subunit